MSMHEFLIDFVYAAKELFFICLDLAVGIVKGILLALNEILFVFPQAYIFWGMMALVLVLLLGDTLNKSLKYDQRRHEEEYQRQLKIKRDFERLQEEKRLKREASEERLRQIRQSLRLPVGVIKLQQQMQKAKQAHGHTLRHK